MFLEMQDFDFFPNLIKFYPNLSKFAQILSKFVQIFKMNYYKMRPHPLYIPSSYATGHWLA